MPFGTNELPRDCSGTVWTATPSSSRLLPTPCVLPELVLPFYDKKILDVLK